MIIIILQTVTEIYMEIDDGMAYFTLKTSVRKQGEGS